MQQLPAREAVFHSLLVSQLTVNEHEDVGSLALDKRQNIRLCASKAVDIPEPHRGFTRSTFGGAALLASRGSEDGSGSSVVKMAILGQGGLVEDKPSWGKYGLKQGSVLVESKALFLRDGRRALVIRAQCCDTRGAKLDTAIDKREQPMQLLFRFPRALAAFHRRTNNVSKSRAHLFKHSQDGSIAGRATLLIN
jgi:hypothetical protein